MPSVAGVAVSSTLKLLPSKLPSRACAEPVQMRQWMALSAVVNNGSLWFWKPVRSGGANICQVELLRI